MIVICYGMLKSGSTLAFELCKGVLERRGHKQRRLQDGIVAPGHSINFLSSITASSLSAISSATADGEIIAVKTHFGIQDAEAKLLEAGISEDRFRVHVNFRDPREVCLSLLDAGDRARRREKARAFVSIDSMEKSMVETNKQLRHCMRWGGIGGALHLFYNDVAFEVDPVIDRMAKDLGVDALTPDEKREVVKYVFNEAFTQRNKAVIDRYKDELSVRENETLLKDIKGARRFIKHVCEQRDYGWFKSAGRA